MMSTGKKHLQRGWVLALAFALLAAACSGGTTTLSESSSESDTEEPTAVPQEPEPTAIPEPTAVPEPTAAPTPTTEPEPTPESEPEVTVFWGSEIVPGTCINRLPDNPPFQPPDIIACDDFHEEEIYAAAQLDFPPGAPFPGEDEVADLVDSELCAQATLDFGGETWDLLPFDTFLLYPLEEEWDAGDRNIFCSATPPEGTAFKIGTAAGGTLDTDDVLIARSGFTSAGEEFEDWAVITELTNIDNVRTLTDGQFDLPLRRPTALAEGLIFTAHEGGPGTAQNVWAYDWDTQEFADFGNFTDEAELSTVAVSPLQDTVLAVKETPDADWDLWLATADSDFALLVGGPGNQRFPTFTPDYAQIVYHDEGNLWIVDLDGSNARQLTDDPANDWESAVSPDGSTLVFASDRTGDDDLWSMPLDGSAAPINLTNHPADDIWPLFSEDGSLIYFSTDRLDPIDDVAKLMVMNADGSNPSWFSAVNASQAVLAPAEVHEQLLLAPTLNERYNYDVVVGDPGTTTVWSHSSGRLTTGLPAGWRVGELTESLGFVASPNPDTYFERWEIDGVRVELYDDLSSDEFFALYDDTDAVFGCEQFDGSDGIDPISERLDGLAGNFNCGDEGAVGGVIMFYNNETGVGVKIEGQRDNLPDAESDSDMLTAIARNLEWE